MKPLTKKLKQQHLGVLLMFLSVLAWAILDGVIKALTERYSLFQIIFFRDSINVLLITLFGILPQGIAVLRTKQIKIHIWRALLLLFNAVGFTYAVSQISLGDAYSLGFSAPIFMMAMASTYLHEKIHWQRWICLFLGFVGILIILRPDGSVFQFAGGIALLTGITYAISNVLVKRLDANDSNISIVFYPSVMIALIAAIWLPSVWIMPTPGDWMLFLLAGVLGWAALQSLVMALRLAPVSIVAPLEYSSLLWVVGIDYVFFNLVPSLNMMAGACLIIVSNLYIVFHEAKFRPQDYLHDAD